MRIFTFAAKGCPLRHTEPVLLIDDRQLKPLKVDRLFNQCVGSDQELDLPISKAAEDFVALGRRSIANEQADL